MIYYRKTFKSKYKLQNYFIRMNQSIDFDLLWEKIWPWRVIYFNKLLQTLKKDNEVNFDLLNLPEWTLKKLRSLMVKEWIVKKIKIWDNSSSKYYLNPYYATITKEIDTELYNAFNKINNWIIY